MSRLVIRLDCADRPGIVARLTALLEEHRWNLSKVEERIRPDDPKRPEARSRFFIRVHAIPLKDAQDPRPALEALVCRKLNGHLTATDPSRRLRIGLMMSRAPDSPMEILDRCRTGDIPGDVVAMIANQPGLEWIRRAGDPKLHVIPNERDNRREAERRMVSILEQARVDLVVMARYMRKLEPWMVDRFKDRLINIHHSGLPAFPGDDPYLQAWEHGVKVIGATAHYATERLDDGPIIAQRFRDIEDDISLEMMRREGARNEREALAAAVQAHAQGRVTVYGRKTVVFRPDGKPYGNPD